MKPVAKKTAAAAAALALFAAPFEGRKLTPYYDPPGILTVCYGHTGADVVKGRRYTDAECMALLEKDAAEAVRIVDRCQPGLPFKVLVSFADSVFNSGPKIACDQVNSTAARMLAAGNLEQACRQHLRWNKARVAGVLTELPGLTKRTKAREALCLEGVSELRQSLMRSYEQMHRAFAEPVGVRFVGWR